MVIDAAKGIETQTRKLFEVCRLRRLPILTFVNKLDQPGRDPLELMDEIESVLGIKAAPLNWPIGSGDRFRGVYDMRVDRAEHLRAGRREQGAPVEDHDHTDPARARPARRVRLRAFLESFDLLRARARTFLATNIWPAGRPRVFFGSALTNFGLEPLLRRPHELAPPPRPRGRHRASSIRPSPTSAGSCSRFRRTWIRAIATASPSCASARDASPRTWSSPTPASARRCAPRARTGSSARTGRPWSGRTPAMSSAWSTPDKFAIGDTLYAGERVRFPPVRGSRPSTSARAAAGYPGQAVRRWPETARGRGPDAAALRWLRGDPQEIADATIPTTGVVRATDREGRPVLLFESAWHVGYCEQQNPGVEFVTVG
jgi:peptide chain release factor 3